MCASEWEACCASRRVRTWLVGAMSCVCNAFCFIADQLNFCSGRIKLSARGTGDLFRNYKEK